MIELSEMISELRRELDQAMDAGADERLRFELGPVEVEVTVGLDSKGTAGAKVRFWVVELGGDAELARSSLQRIKLTLQPRLAGARGRPEISDAKRPGER
jgi:Trypsin-co-occurring domain 2